MAGVQGIEVNVDNTGEFVEGMASAIEAALEEMGLAGERFAKTGTPVDTGRLRNSVTHAIDSDERAVYVGTNVEYAPYVELGVHGKGGVGMLRHAAEDHAEYYRSILERHLRGPK